ncbi:conserved hypothetical protein [Singulisphaera sp. GP187]|uniref:mucoidy inhibitor MuiA family protein n=1 Tax=Singulisphaera sp. GP187 TaxID=1882752 RepID=UPI00092BE14E|nr:mucoidy inhibitor MuiA family protein [Singulisphaera sp. GP187]SIO40824.1 conserved hypothetical protein [Singulisphaera sp. GP187]
MNTAFWLVAALACAQFGGMVLGSAPANADQNAQTLVENVPPPRPAASRIVAVTVYQGQALVTREVSVPEGEGTIELVVTPLPPQTVDGSLYTEGIEGLRVLSTRYRTRAVKEDTREAVRAKEAQLKKLQADAERLKNEVAVQVRDLQYLEKLEGFTGSALTNLTAKGRLDSEGVLTLSKFVMESRGLKAKAQTELHQQLLANTEGAEFTKRQLTEMSAGSSRVERDAVIVVHKTRPDAGTVRLGYLVGAADWSPQYRLRGGADDAPVRIECLAAVVQQTGEAWSDVRVTLSTARPSLDAAPPELLPLKMNIAETVNSGPIASRDDRSMRIAEELGKLIDLPFKEETPLEDVIKFIRSSTRNSAFPEGIPIYVDPVGLQEAEKTMTSPVLFDLPQVPLKTSLKLILKQLGMVYQVRDGLLMITSSDSEDLVNPDGSVVERGFAGGGFGGGGMAGMGGMGFTLEKLQATGSVRLNQAAASDQAEEMRVQDDPAAGLRLGEKDSPSVTFNVVGRIDIPSRRDPQLLEVNRVELPAEYYAKAVPVLSPRVYRLAKLTNKSDLVLLPGEATVYVGTDFVGRMKLPLVAAGEPFVVGFGVDPQLQVGRRLVHKSRTVQGGNQVFSYEFRISLRNYRPGPVKVQLWDRLPSPDGEAVVVNLVKTSAALSTDALYERTARTDNLLRWDLEVPPGTVGDKTMSLNYEFRLEYARDLPQPRFISGGLGEAPIGGGAMGMGGMGGGMR